MAKIKCYSFEEQVPKRTQIMDTGLVFRGRCRVFLEGNDQFDAQVFCDWAKSRGPVGCFEESMDIPEEKP